MSSAPTPTLGSLLSGLRARNGWTLKQMSDQCGIPVSTLSKVEHDRLTLTYDKLQQLSRRLGMRMSELFAEEEDEGPQPVTARRSIGDHAHAVRVQTPNYDYYYLHTELRRKRMIPVSAVVSAKSVAEFGPLVRHAGEEFFYVVRGRIAVHTDFYDPVVLDVGQSMYIDSTMGHAYLVADGCDEAEVIGVMSSGDDELMQSLLDLHEEQRGRSAATTPKAVRDRAPR
ncbi:helix-turn-helix domain-containing protein [uncultured Sphingomonas sp.]|uniref:helix-turn-helix domain-containing protein n=1 Tax=uncultured Sphingomonas sp. TaxID=158754 RepID=UPI0035C955F4